MIVHLRMDGRSTEFAAADIGLTAQSSDGDVRNKLAARLDVAPARLDGYAIDRGPDGNVVVRPQAVYG